MDQKRLVAGMVDFLVASMLQAVLMIPFVMVPVSQGGIDVLPRVLLVTLVSVLYLVVRDNFGAKSLGKRIVGLSVICTSTKATATPVQRLIRNTPWILGPLEPIVLLATGKRIGDRIAGTEVGVCPTSIRE